MQIQKKEFNFILYMYLYLDTEQISVFGHWTSVKDDVLYSYDLLDRKNSIDRLSLFLDRN